jgi:hypothetical protein
LAKRILIISSCTGEKSITSNKHLTQSDFEKGKAHLKKKEQALGEYLTPAAELYSGQQHIRLMRGIEAIASQSDASVDVSLYILSAAYGLVRANRKLAPYEVTFSGMRKTALRQWADDLGIPGEFRKSLSTPYDLGLILLGDSYLEACDLPIDINVAGPTLFFCSASRAKKIPSNSSIRAIPLTNEHAKRFSCGLVGLKGEIASRLLSHILDDPESITKISKPKTDVLKLIETSSVVATPKRTRQQAVSNPNVDQVIKLPQTWVNKPHREKLRYFIPEWDDLVDPDYDFKNDVHSGGTGDWSNEVYAHQMYSEPNYDGILMSRAVAEKSQKKKKRINELGVHRYLRVPRHFPIMGDCGAFDYIDKDEPPYTTLDVLNYYTRLDFDMGVSVDHLVVPAFAEKNRFRYDLTIHNAHEFFQEHKKQKLPWTPMGAVQGWDPGSYADAAKQYVKMGYRYIGLGGLVRASTKEVMRTLEEVHQVIPPNVSVHLFGLARLNAMHQFAKLGVRSVDSASFLRRAWLGTGQNYLTPEGIFYSAIRIPQAETSFRAKRMVSEGRATLGEVKRLESACLTAIRAFDKGHSTIEKTLSTLQEYDQLITPDRPDNIEELATVLEAQPWKRCPCPICLENGVEVIIFRGNNRNRRRGFHNTYVFYQLLQKSLAGDSVVIQRGTAIEASDQIQLFSSQQS